MKSGCVVVQVYTLNSLYTEGKEAQGWGTFGYRHIKGKPLEAPIKLKLSSPNKVGLCILRFSNTSNMRSASTFGTSESHGPLCPAALSPSLRAFIHASVHVKLLICHGWAVLGRGQPHVWSSCIKIGCCWGSVPDLSLRW